MWRGVEANIQPEDWELGMQCDGRTIHTVKFLKWRAGLGVRRGQELDALAMLSTTPSKNLCSWSFLCLGSFAPTCSSGMLTSLRHLLKHHWLREAFPNHLSLSLCPDLQFLAFLKPHPMLYSTFICLLSCLLQYKNVSHQGPYAFCS